jgi:tetratricopeptide (TPR) repeat protein
MGNNEEESTVHPAPDDRTGRVGEDEMRRRELLGSLAGLGLIPPTLTALDDTRHAAELMLSRAQSQTAGIDYAELAAERHSYGYHGRAPLAVLADIAADFSDIRPLLASVRTPATRTRVCRASAQLAGMIGIVLHDLGNRREAHGWFHTAYLAAEETEDPNLKAWILAREAMVPLNFGAPHAAANLATQARTIAGDRTTASAALACAVASRAHAQLGRDDEALEALSKAESISEQLRGEAATDTWVGYPEQKHHVHASQTLTHLGQTRRAYASQSRALELSRSPDNMQNTRNGMRALSTALIELDRAACLHQDGETVEACDQAQRAITALPGELRVALVLTRAHGLARAIPADRQALPAVRDLNELISSPV